MNDIPLARKNKSRQNPMKASFAIVAASLVLNLVGSASGWAQIKVQVTSTPNTNIPVLGQYVDTLTIANAGLATITDVNVNLNLSSAPGMTMRLGQMYAQVTHGTEAENERVAVLLNRPGVSDSSRFGSGLQSINITLDDAAASNVFAIAAGSGTYAADGRIGVNPFGSRVAYDANQITAGLTALNGDWLASGTWSLLVADVQDGNQARLNSWGLDITGNAATDGVMSPGRSGRIAAAGAGTQQIGASVSSDGSGAEAVALEAAAGKTLQLDGGLSGAGDFRKEGSGVVRLTAAASGFSGKVKVDSGEVEVANSSALGTGSLEVASGAALKVAAGVDLANNVAVTGTNKVALSGGSSSSDVSTISSVISGSGGIEKTGAGRMVLAGTNTFTGATTVSEGKLVVNGSIANSSTTVANGGTLGGSGSVGALTVASGGTLAVGNSPGQLNAGNTTWAGGAELDWEVVSSVGNQIAAENFLAGKGTNWDFLNVTGTLNITATSTNMFIIDVISLLNNTTNGAAAGFNLDTPYTFGIATASGGIQIGGLGRSSYASDSAFDSALSALFDINTGSFANNPGSDALWSISTAAGTGTERTLLLSYAGTPGGGFGGGGGGGVAIPEPSSAALTLIGLGVLALRRRCRR